MKIVEVLGSPDAGKTTALKSLSSLLTEMGISNDFVIETRGKNIFPKSERGTLEYNCKVGKITCDRISSVIKRTKSDIILVDKGYVDYLYWVHYYLYNGKCSEEEAKKASQLYKELNLLPDIVIAMTCNPEIATSRCEDAVETRTVAVQKSIDCLMSFYENWDITPKYLLDTSYMSKTEVVDELSEIIFSN